MCVLWTILPILLLSILLAELFLWLSENENVMILNIDGYEKILHMEFVDRRFVCSKFHETQTNYRWQFYYRLSRTSRVFWIELSRNGHLNKIDKKWHYSLNYIGIKSSHEISPEWFTMDNAVWTFESILNGILTDVVKS